MSEYERKQIRRLIDLIIEDYESRICKNCKHFKNSECRIFQGAKAQCTIYELDENFGCNKFERKEDEQNRGNFNQGNTI